MRRWRAIRHGWDLRLLGAALALSAMSAAAMASASVAVHPQLAGRHAASIAIGVAASVLLASADYRRWTDLAWLGYGLGIIALVSVLAAGATRLGATRWLSLFGISLQPSELAKLSTVWLLARYLGGQPRPLPWRTLASSLLIAGPPAALVFLQPDLGSSSVFGALWLGMVWVAGGSRKSFGWLAGGLLTALPVGWMLLKGYQRARLVAFLDPHADPLGAGYTVIQSTIAIGSGRLWGRGWFAGTQHQLRFLPERHSDFIFAVIGEEWGFLGCLAAVALFGLLLARIARVGLESSDPQGRLLAGGVFAWIGYQALVNMGMVMGLLPVVGVPLPFVSYGGSSMVSLWCALGLLQSVRRSDR